MSLIQRPLGCGVGFLGFLELKATTRWRNKKKGATLVYKKSILLRMQLQNIKVKTISQKNL